MIVVYVYAGNTSPYRGQQKGGINRLFEGAEVRSINR